MSIISCPKCGAKYELREHKIITRDKDSIECFKCDTTLRKWNGAVMYTIELIEDDKNKNPPF